MRLIPDIKPQVAPAEQIAIALSDGLETAFRNRLAEHRRFFLMVWAQSATPDEILETLGTGALRILQCASENVDHLNRLAAIDGKALADFLPPEFFVPPREFIPEIIDGIPTGIVTLAPPAEGHDAWGRPLPEPEIEHEPDDDDDK